MLILTLIVTNRFWSLDQILDLLLTTDLLGQKYVFAQTAVSNTPEDTMSKISATREKCPAQRVKKYTFILRRLI